MVALGENSDSFMEGLGSYLMAAVGKWTLHQAKMANVGNCDVINTGAP